MKTFDHTSSLDFLLVLPADIPSAPYVEYYTRIMQNEKRTWKIITWHRNNDHSNLYQNNELPFPLVCNNSISKVRKFFLYTKFSTFISRKIRIFRPRVILFFTLELPIITLLTYRIDRHTYFLDIRDRSDVLNSFFPFLRDWVINKSKACFISSKSFCKWLPPQKNYCYSPNISSFFLREHKKTARDRINYPRKVLFMGQVRYYEITYQFIKSLPTDSFVIDFVGTFLSNENHFKALPHIFPNVNLLGKYQKDSEIEIASQYDFIAILLPGKSKDNMTNRFYTALTSGVPIIANEGSMAASYIQKYPPIGVVIPDDMNQVSIYLKDYICGFSSDDFAFSREEVLKEVEKEISHFEDSFHHLISHYLPKVPSLTD